MYELQVIIRTGRDHHRLHPVLHRREKHLVGLSSILLLLVNLVHGRVDADGRPELDNHSFAEAMSLSSKVVQPHRYNPH